MMLLKYRLKNLIKWVLKCPHCHGEGGWTEPVTDEGYGPWEPCGVCGGKGTLSLFWKLYFVSQCKKWEKEDREMKKRWREEEKKRKELL
jgi:DnaJ-class molecular chaperone